MSTLSTINPNQAGYAVSIADMQQRALAMVRDGSFEEVLQVKRDADFATELAKQYNLNEQECVFSSLKVVSRRRLGAFLKGMTKPGRPGKGSPKEPLLSEFQLTKKQSHQWQKIASIPDDKFEEYIRDKAEKQEPCTQADLLRMAKSRAKQEKSEETAEPHPEACTVDDLQALIESGQRFAQIYADPPWQYGNQGTRAATSNHYETMTVEELLELPVGDLAAENAQLHLWTTNGFLFECPRLFEAWGFEFKSAFVWCKPQMGMGNYWRNCHEYLLTATRGSATFKSKSLRSWVEHPRREHSAKPHQVREFVEQAFDGPRLELFGREQRPGWTVWGNQVSRQKFLVEVPA